MRWRVVIVGGHTRSIGKTQLVCDLIAAFPHAKWVAGKITQYGHGVCARKGKCCDCAPEEHICALSWEKEVSATDSGRFLMAGAQKSFWLRTKQGYLAEGMPLLRSALNECEPSVDGQPANLILESNTLLEFLKPSMYLMVLDPDKADFKESARRQIDAASAFVLRRPWKEMRAAGQGTWTAIPEQGWDSRPQFLQQEGEPLPDLMRERIRVMLADNNGLVM